MRKLDEVYLEDIEDFFSLFISRILRKNVYVI